MRGECAPAASWLTPFSQPREPRQCLQRLAQTHVVGQHAAETIGREIRKEMEAFDLIGPELGANALGHGWRNAGFEFGSATMNFFSLLFGQKLSGRRVGQLQGVQALRLGREIPALETFEGNKILAKDLIDYILSENLVPEEFFTDAAALGAKKEAKYGGINLNPAVLDLQIKRDGNGVPLPLPMQPIGNMKIEGFFPVIINVTPINLPLLMGFNDTKDTQTPANKLGSDDGKNKFYRDEAEEQKDLTVSHVQS
jgi:hypothetical protein